MDRREFLKALGRLAVLGGLSLIGIKVLPGRGRRPASRTCSSGGLCPTCGALRDCGLPQALSYKRGARRS